MANDPYAELGIARGASQEEVRKAFRKLAKQFHPDKNPGDAKAEERFKQISSAFDILGDEEKRKKFDRGEIDADGREQFRGGHPGGGGSPFGAGGPAGFRGNFEGVDLDEIFSMFGGGGAGRTGRGGGFAPPPKGVDVRARVDIDLEDSILGATKRIAFSDGRTLDVAIPKGAASGQVLRLKGQGQAGRGGAVANELNGGPGAAFGSGVCSGCGGGRWRGVAPSRPPHQMAVPLGEPSVGAGRAGCLGGARIGRDGGAWG